MNFQRIDDAIATCAKHLDATSTRNTEIENFLVSYLLVLIGAEYEQCLRSLYLSRTAKGTDKHVSKAAAHALSKYASRYELGDITHNLEHFGDDDRDTFKGRTKDPVNALIVAGHGTICSNRNSVAHGSGTLMTLAELEKAFADGNAVFTIAAESLDFTAAEIAALTW